MKIKKEFEINFYRLSRFMGKDLYKEVTSAQFWELDKFEPALCKWIENEVIAKVPAMDKYFKSIGLYSRDLQAQMFLRLYYATECEKIEQTQQSFYG